MFFPYAVRMQDKATIERLTLGGGKRVPLRATGSSWEGPVLLQWALPLPFMWLLFDLATSVL